MTGPFWGPMLGPAPHFLCAPGFPAACSAVAAQAAARASQLSSEDAVLAAAAGAMASQGLRVEETGGGGGWAWMPWDLDLFGVAAVRTPSQPTAHQLT